MLRPSGYPNSNKGWEWVVWRVSAQRSMVSGAGGLSINDDHGLTLPLLNTISCPSSQTTG